MPARHRRDLAPQLQAIPSVRDPANAHFIFEIQANRTAPQATALRAPERSIQILDKCDSSEVQIRREL
jgi:hypothetical protein